MNGIFGGDRYAQCGRTLWAHDLPADLRMLRMGIDEGVVSSGGHSRRWDLPGLHPTMTSVGGVTTGGGGRPSNPGVTQAPAIAGDSAQFVMGGHGAPEEDMHNLIRFSCLVTTAAVCDIPARTRHWMDGRGPEPVDGV